MKKRVKDFKTFEEQRDILVNRNVEIENINDAQQLLEDTNYYNLMSYRDLFGYDNRKNVFIKRVRLSDIKNLYYFDTDLRGFLFKYISYIESSLKTKISYVHSKEYGPVGYRDINNFERSAYNEVKRGLTYHEEIMASLKKEIDRSKEDYIIWHLNTYEDLPFWVAINKMSFSDMSKFYNLLIHSDKKSVSKYFNAGPYQIKNWLRQLSILRNVCAHQGNLLIWKYQDIPLDGKYKSKYKERTFYQYIIAIYHLIRCDDISCKYIEEFSLLIKKLDKNFWSILGIPSSYEDDLIELNIAKPVIT